MGRDKATLPWRPAGDLLDHAMARLTAVTPDVRILCGSETRYADRGRPAIVDAVRDVGAIAALLTALRALTPGETALLLAVDLPLVPVSLLQHLAEAAGRAEAVVPVSPRGAEPFCAAYRAECRPAVERAVADGRLKMTAFWSDVQVSELPSDALARFGDPSRLFSNVNTLEDYERALLTEP